MPILSLPGLTGQACQAQNIMIYVWDFSHAWKYSNLLKGPKGKSSLKNGFLWDYQNQDEDFWSKSVSLILEN